ncbi:MAG: hypothetical protein AB8B99_17635 [Phormidesmis sp.]
MTSANRTNLKHFWTEVQGPVLATATALLMVRECIVVSIHLGQIFDLAGILAASLFIGTGCYMFSLVSKRLRRWQKNLSFSVIGAAIFSVLSNAGAANAQFLQNAEDFFVEGATTFNLGNSVTLLVTLIFWIIRGAFVIGVAIALLPAIQAAREGDEWRSLAKTPMLVVGIVLAGATSVDFLVGAGGGAAPAP